MLQSSKRKLSWAELLSIMVAKANSVMNSCSQPRHRAIIRLLSFDMSNRLSLRMFSTIGRCLCLPLASRRSPLMNHARYA